MNNITFRVDYNHGFWYAQMLDCIAGNKTKR